MYVRKLVLIAYGCWHSVCMRLILFSVFFFFTEHVSFQPMRRFQQVLFSFYRLVLFCSNKWMQFPPKIVCGVANRVCVFSATDSRTNRTQEFTTIYLFFSGHCENNVTGIIVFLRIVVFCWRRFSSFFLLQTDTSPRETISKICTLAFFSLVEKIYTIRIVFLFRSRLDAVNSFSVLFYFISSRLKKHSPRFSKEILYHHT